MFAVADKHANFHTDQYKNARILRHPNTNTDHGADRHPYKYQNIHTYEDSQPNQYGWTFTDAYQYQDINAN